MQKNSLLYGSVAGLLTIAVYLAAYASDKNLIFKPWIGYGTYLFYIVAMYYVAVKTRDLTEDAFPWKEALRTAFLTFLVANTVYYLFYYFLHQSDPELAAIQKELVREMLPKISSPEQLKESMKALESDDFRLRPGQALLGWAQGAIFGFALAAAIAVITKRES